MFNYTSGQSPSLQEFFIQQYEIHSKICSQYLKITSERLYLDEAHRISQANILLEQISCKEKVKDVSEWDIFTTRDSVLQEDLSLSNIDTFTINLSNITTEGKGKPITRRNAIGSRTSRVFDGNMSEILAEIEKSCSPRSVNFVRKLFDDHKKLKGKAAEAEKKDKASKLKEKLLQELQQKTIMLSQKLQEQQYEINRFRCENTHLRSENHELNQAIFILNNQLNSEKKLKLYEEIAITRAVPPNDNFILAKVVEEKENIIKFKQESVKAIEQKIQGIVFNQDNSCEDCCNRLHKLKQSIFSYKHYLEEEGDLFQDMFDSFRKRIEKTQEQSD